MRLEGVEQFTTKGQEPFNPQMAEQLQRLQAEQFSANNPSFEEGSVVAEEVDESLGNNEEITEIDLNSLEQLDELRSAMKEQVNDIEALRPYAAATGYKNISYHDLVGADCFDELMQKQSELEAVLAELEEQLRADETYRVSDDEQEEISLHVDLMQDLIDSIEASVVAPDITPEQSADTTFESAAETVSTQAERATELYNTITNDIRYQSQRFPVKVRSEAVHQLLHGLQADAKRAEELQARAPEEDVAEYLDELQVSLEAYRTEADRLYESLLPEIKQVHAEGQSTDVEPLILTEDMRVSEVVPSHEQTRVEANKLVQTVDQNPYFSTTERTTVKFLYDQLQDAIEQDADALKLQQKLENISDTVTALTEHPSADALQERVKRIEASLSHEQFYTSDDRQTVEAMIENFVRQYEVEEPDETVLRQVYDSIVGRITESTLQTPSLFGVSLPEAGEASSEQVRALRRKLIAVADAEKQQLTRSQRVDIERAITVLEYAAHDTLEEHEAAQLKALAERIQAREPILPYNEADFVKPAEVDTGEIESVASSGRVSVSEHEPDSDSETSAIRITNKRKKTPEEVLSELKSLEPQVAEETFDYWDDAVEEAAEESFAPAPIVREPVVDTSAADAAALAAVERQDPVSVLEPFELTDDVLDAEEESAEVEGAEQPLDPNRLHSWQERSLRAEKLSTAKQLMNKGLLSNEVITKLRERDLTPSDIDRKTQAFVKDFERRYISQFDRWLGENTKSAYEVWRDTSVAEFQALQEDYSARSREDLQTKYDVKYDTFVAWQDLLKNELLEVVTDVETDMTLAELLTAYVAILESQ